MRPLLAIFLLLCVLCSLYACVPTEADYFACFAGEFSAELDGNLRGMDFAARLDAHAPPAEGVREATITFFEPEALSGLTVTRTADGTLTLSSGGLSLPVEGAQGYHALFDLFPTAGEITEISLEGEYTHVRGTGFALVLRADGTPARAENEAVCADVVSFTRP